MSWWSKLKRRRNGQCVDCGERLKLQRIDLCRFKERVSDTVTYEILVDGLPVLGCSDSTHRRQFAMPAWSDAVLDAVLKAGDFPISKLGRFKETCFRCQSKLNSNKATVERVEGKLKVGELPAFGVQVQGHCFQCGACGTVQLANSIAMGETTAGLIIAAAKSANTGK